MNVCSRLSPWSPIPPKLDQALHALAGASRRVIGTRHLFAVESDALAAVPS